MLIPSSEFIVFLFFASLSRGMNANSQHRALRRLTDAKSIKRDEC